MYKVKITEGSGEVWFDNQTWIDEPDEEDCIREYNQGCTIEIFDENENEVETYEI